jgi:Tfp pilus assembly protein PilO
VTRKALIPAVAAVAAIAAFYFLALAPKREEIAKLDGQIEQEQTATQQAEAQAAVYAKAKDNYKANYAMVARLGKAVPADDDIRSLLIQIDAAAKAAKVDFGAMNVGTGGGAAPAAPTDGTTAPPAAPGAVPVGSAGFSAMPFNFRFSGNYFRLSDFMSRLERFVTVENENIDVTGRLLLLGSVAVTPNATDPSQLTAEIGAASYIVPATQGVTGGATPTAPAGAAGTEPAPADGTTATTTASITGVR